MSRISVVAAVAAAVVVTISILPETSATRVSYSCNTKQRYTTDCGFWNFWSSCTRYRTQIRTCYRNAPIHGGWSSYGSWTSYSTCTRPCGGGTQVRSRTRSCTNPRPAYGGRQCYGSTTETASRRCNTHYCIIHGGWSSYGSWTSYSTCTRSCGGGTQVRSRTRSCTNPRPAYGGRQCYGSTTETASRRCNTHYCAIDGGWTDWEEWQDRDDCTVLCGGGGKKDQERARSCTNPAPAYGGAECEGENYQNRTVDCGVETCGDLCPGNTGKLITHATNNKRFYQCSNGVAYRQNCPEGTVFNPDPVVPGCKHVPSTPKPASTCPSPFATLAKEDDCSKFIQCVHGQLYERSCAVGTIFNLTTKTCVHGHC